MKIDVAILGATGYTGAELIRLPERDGPPRRKRPPESAMRALLGHSAAEVERELILVTLACCRGNRTHAAEILDIDRVTLHNRLKKYGWKRDATEV